MKKFKDFLLEFTKTEIKKPEYKWLKDPKIGWWADRSSLLMYHGTHINNLEAIIENGIYAPKSGPTANWVSMALDPYTANGYASMGGESAFRAAGAKARHIPENERVVLVCKFPMSWIQQNMEKNFRGNVDSTRDKLTNKERYLEHKKSGKTDHEYYALTELRFPKHIDPKFIIGYMRKIR